MIVQLPSNSEKEETDCCSLQCSPVSLSITDGCISKFLLVLYFSHQQKVIYKFYFIISHIRRLLHPLLYCLPAHHQQQTEKLSESPIRSSLNVQIPFYYHSKQSTHPHNNTTKYIRANNNNNKRGCLRVVFFFCARCWSPSTDRPTDPLRFPATNCDYKW